MRYKTSTILNIIGLSCAFATFIIISMQIRYDVTYDRYHENNESIYKLTNKGKRGVGGSLARPTIIKVKENMPEIEHISVLSKKYVDRITLLGENERDIAHDITTCDEDITKIFTFEFVEGDESALKDPSNLIVSDKFAKNWYGDKSPIGEMVLCKDEVYTIAAVYKSFPRNGTFQGDIFCNMGDENINDTGNRGHSAFFKLNEKYSQEVLEDKLMAAIGKEYYKEEYGSNIVPTAVELADIRYVIDKYDKNIIYLMLLIALSIIVLAVINFINFAISMVPLKIRGINLRKVVGATQSELRACVIWESVTLALLSLIIAIGVVEIFKDSSFSYIISDLSWETNKIVYLITFGISILIGVISGLYPAFYSTSFQPALMLKSSFALSASGRRFRMALIGFQFFISITFITITLFIQLQHSYMLNQDGGYVKEGIVHVDHGWDFDKQNILKEELLKNNQVKDVTFSESEFGTERYGFHIGDENSKGKFTLALMPVSYNFLDFFGIKMYSGRNFMQSDELSEKGYIIASRVAMDELGFLPEEKILGLDNIGVSENIHLSNMKYKLYPYVFMVYGRTYKENLSHSYIKVSGNSKEIFEHIQNSYKKTDSDIMIDVNYLTTELDNAYYDENTIKQIMQSFSLIAIIIALVGVFGLVSFDTKYRRKEISLRRINGATVSEILRMFSTSYVKIMLISFVLSVPVIYYFIFNWLKNFPYKIDIYWWVFAVALLMVFVLTLIISATQTITAAKRNPIESLKSE